MNINKIRLIDNERRNSRKVPNNFNNIKIENKNNRLRLCIKFYYYIHLFIHFAGHPMKIIYFISPYDLLDITKKTSKPLTLDLPEVDYSVSLCLESSSTNKLQTQPLVKIIKAEKVDENPDSHQP